MRMYPLGTVNCPLWHEEDDFLEGHAIDAHLWVWA